MSVNRARMIPGLVLIALGIVILLMQFGAFGPGVFLVFLGLVFLIPYALTRAYGLLIPGCILAGIGVGLLFDRAPLNPAITVPLGLGLGFVAMFVAHFVVTRERHGWSLIPGGLLALAGIAAGSTQMQALVEKGAPLALVLIGLLILAGQFRKSAAKTKS